MKIICTVKDNATEAYGIPFFVRHENEAKRMFANEVGNAESLMGKNPADFELFKVGMFNDQNGEIEGMTPSRLARALDFTGEQA